MHVTINGVEYALASTLRVAFQVQGQHGHKPYSQVFSEIGDMPLESQIAFLYAAFQVANPSSKITEQQFLNSYLDNYDLKTMMNMIKEVIQGIMGTEVVEPGATDTSDNLGN